MFPSILKMNTIQRLAIPSTTSASIFNQIRNFNANRCYITKINRAKYLRMYPTLVVCTDGSSFTIRHTEPRKLIKQPLTLEEMSTDKQKKEWLLRRRPRTLSATKDQLPDVGFDKNQYLNLIKKK